LVGDTVYLDGSRSFDANGDLLTYRWSLISGPAGSSVTLNATTPQASFLADQPGDYVVSLVVNDGFKNSAPNIVTITLITRQDAATENLMMAWTR
jgi:hypothetical protein